LFCTPRPPPASTLFPYTTLFRSALRAPRGLVLDRGGRILVDNRGSYSISIVREHTKDLNRTIRLLAAVLRQDEADRAIQILRVRSEEHTSELQSRSDLVCRLLLE